VDGDADDRGVVAVVKDVEEVDAGVDAHPPQVQRHRQPGQQAQILADRQGEAQIEAQGHGPVAHEGHLDPDLRIGHGLVPGVVGLGVVGAPEDVGGQPLAVADAQAGAEPQLQRGGEADAELEVEADAGVVGDVREARAQPQLPGRAREHEPTIHVGPGLGRARGGGEEESRARDHQHHTAPTSARVHARATIGRLARAC
jgi:hypothetical protein